MQRLNLLVAVLLLQFVIACGDGGTQMPTTPPPPANRAPTASAAIPDQSVEEGAQVAVDVSGAFSDPDGDALRYGATSDASSVATASVSGSSVVAGVTPGSATVTATATDPGGLSAGPSRSPSRVPTGPRQRRPRSRTRAWKRERRWP